MWKQRGSRARAASSAALPEGAVGEDLRRALQWFARDASFADLRLHGNVGWTAVRLVLLATLWAWSEHPNLTGAFAQATDIARGLFGQVAVTSYQGLMSALRSYREQLLPALWRHLHRRMEQAAGPHWRIGPWLPLAVDGSRVTAPRTLSNEQAFAAAHFGQGGRARSRTKWKNKRRRSKKLATAVKPQIWLTLVWHMGLKMPWCWKTGPSTACERHHLLELLETQDFPADTLFCADAGFVGYDLWSTLAQRGGSFLIRVGANVHLLRKLAYVRQRSDLVYLWPNAVARRRQPPLVLRLLVFQGVEGPVYLVTNVLAVQALSLAQARELYRLRWGIELQFRALKQTFGRRKLRSRTAANALVELDWSLVGLWLIQLFAVKEQIRLQLPPANSSVALALHVIHDAMRNWTAVFPRPIRLQLRLGAAVRDQYERRTSKRARYRPAYKDQPCATQPNIRLATATQRKAYQALSIAA